MFVTLNICITITLTTLENLCQLTPAYLPPYLTSYPPLSLTLTHYLLPSLPLSLTHTRLVDKGLVSFFLRNTKYEKQFVGRRVRVRKNGVLFFRPPLIYNT